MDIRDLMAEKIPNYNGNNKVIGVLSSGEEVVLTIESSGLKEGEVKDYNTGMVFGMGDFTSFKNYSNKLSSKKTRNHDVNEREFLRGGQNSKRFKHS